MSSHIGCAETVLLKNYLPLLRGSMPNIAVDYHTGGNWDVFSNWWSIKFFPQIVITAVKSVVILSSRRYHKALDNEARYS